MATSVRFSVQTPIEGTTFAALARHWQRAEELGYDSAWLDDHFYGVATPPSDDSLECWTLMAALARETSRLRFGALVTCNNYRHPPLLAKMAATLDHVSDGRLEFGLGAGWYEHEYVAYGYDFPAVGTRLAQLEEALQICTLDVARGARHLRRPPLPGGERVVQPEAGAEAASADHDRRRRRESAAAASSRSMPTAGTSAARWTSSDTSSPSSSGTARAVGRDPAAIERSWFGNILIEPDEARLAGAPGQARRARARRCVRAERDGRHAGADRRRASASTSPLGVTHFIAMFGRVERLGATELFAREVIPAFR